MQNDFSDTPSSQESDSKTTPSNHELLMSRRHFLYGALGVGALAVAASSTVAPTYAYADDDDFSYLEVPEEAVHTLDDYTEVPAEESVYLAASFELPYGTLIWSNNESYAACLLPTETSRPLTQAGVLYLSSGHYNVLLQNAVDQASGFDIYDIRLNDKGMIWTEANVLSGIWRIYTATFNGEVMGEPFLAAEGDAEWETPTIAAVGSFAYWQTLPVATGSHSSEYSTLRRVGFGKINVEEIYASLGRMSTPIYPLTDSLVITPRTDTDTVHHQLTLIDGESGKTKDSLVLPTSMKPLEAGYGDAGFNFAFDGIYSYGGGIANLGTYTPESAHDTYDYQNKTWFRFGRTPSAPPSWCKGLFIVKSSYSVCGVSLDNKTYFSLEVESGSDTYGDYLASTGALENFVTFCNVDTKSIYGDERKVCFVRVWARV